MSEKHAFPMVDDTWDYKSANYGITIRQYYAAKAMQALIHAEFESTIHPNEDRNMKHRELVARSAFMYADEMIAAEKKNDAR